MPLAFESGIMPMRFGPDGPLYVAGLRGNFDIEQWNYKWSKDYGSPEFSVENPTKRGRDTVEIKSAKLADDGRTIGLEIPQLREVMQIEISYNVKSKDGKTVEGKVVGTINRL